MCVCVSGCDGGVLTVIGTAEIEIAGSSHAEGTAEEGRGVESLPFEFSCSSGCSLGQMLSDNMSPICYGT